MFIVNKNLSSFCTYEWLLSTIESYLQMLLAVLRWICMCVYISYLIVNMKHIQDLVGTVEFL